jgi:hypothetical protein
LMMKNVRELCKGNLEIFVSLSFIPCGV